VPRTTRLLAGALLAAAAAAAPRPAAAAVEHPLAAPVRAILLEDDAGLRKVYDGIRKGLELAQLPRVQLETLADTPEAFAEYAKQVAAAPPPLLFLVGRRAAARANEAGIGGPRVFVDTALALKDGEIPAAVEVKAPAAVVRGLTPVSRWSEILSVFPSKVAAGDVRLDLSGPGAQDAAFRASGITWTPNRGVSVGVVFSDDLGRWGKGAAVLLLPDHRLVGRTAAEAGRRLLVEKPAEVLRMSVGATEIRVDLDAAKAAGLDVPLPFAATADVLRGERAR
jgi:hypothetical protein